MSEGAVLAVFYVVAGAVIGTMWHLLSTEGANPNLPRELQFQLWSPEGAAVPFSVLVGAIWPAGVVAMFVWCVGWFLVVGVIESVREYLPGRVSEVSINRPSAYPFGL